jgi:citrate synthase
MAVLEELREPESVEGWVRSRKESGGKIAGFGHQVYRGEDPRTAQLRLLARERCALAGLDALFDTAAALEEAVQRELGQYPIVDFYLAPLYRALGIPTDLFTAVFAVSRMSGWIAHVLEQYGDDKLIRPRAEYVGPLDLSYVPLRRRRA